jgi:hypothetical protein
MYDVRATTAGFIVTGAHVDGTDFKRLTWMSQDGLTWRLLDLVDSSDLGGTVAFGLAAHDGVVVAVGAEVGDEKSIGAIWVSPAPTNVVLSLPATADVDSVPHINEVIPSRAAADTEVAVEVGSAGSGAVLVTVGDTVACNATGPSDSKRCTFTPGSLGIPLGTHEISVGPDSQNWMLEVVPAGTPILTIDAVYQPNTWPLVFAVFVKNRGADPVDLKGWWIADRNGDAYVVRDVTVVPPGGSLTISQAGNEGSPCPPDEGLSRHMCNYFGDAVIDHSNRVWSGSDLTLSDPSGTEVDVWSRPR